MSARGSVAWRAAEWGPGCSAAPIVAAYWIIGAGKIQCHADAVGAFRALGRVFRKWGYHVRSDVTGCYNCRTITGNSSAISAHAQGIAIDVNWDTNPYRLDHVVTDMQPEMIADILAIRTNGGVKAFRWGGEWDGDPRTPQSNYDAMHFEIIATRDELRAGFDVPRPFSGDQRTWPLLDIGEQGPAVTALQQLIAAHSVTVAGLEADGYFGPITSKAVRAYQASRGLPVDGVVGLGTWTALFSVQPQLGISGVRPDKGQTKQAENPT